MTTLGDAQIPVSKTVKSLGITLDDKLSFNTHVDNVCKAAHFHIRALRHIRGCIDEETACMVASSMVGSRLDYCNSVLHGTSAENLGKLQRVLHELARVVSGTRRSDHITPVLARLHWLPVADYIQDRSPDLQGDHDEKTWIFPRDAWLPTHAKDTSIVLEKPSACEGCQNGFRLSRFPPCRTLNLEQSPDSLDWPVFNTGVFQKITWNSFVQ